MNQVNKICFDSEKNGRVLSFCVPDGTPIADAFEFAKELMMSFSNLAEQNKAKEEAAAQPVEVEVVGDSPKGE
jgi:hypothetical protein